MPNYVYAGITLENVTTDQKSILKKIKRKKSFCEYYLPMPKEFKDIVTGGMHIDGNLCKLWRKVDDKNIPVTEEEKQSLLKKFGATNWYDYKLNTYDTKWGDCELEVDIEGGQLNYNTAWSPVGDKILNMFAKDFPDFNYWYEEETGWGGERDYKKGEVVRNMEYDEPEWEQTEYEIGDSVYTITELKEEHPNFDDDGKGFYIDYSHEFAGKTLEEAKKFVKKQHNDWIKTRGKSFEELIK